MNKMNHTIFFLLLKMWKKNSRKIIPEIREIRIEYFNPNFPMGSENFMPHRSKVTLYCVVKVRLRIKFAAQKEAYQIKVHREQSAAKNMFEVKENIQY